jgi:hypothetical protein
MVFESALELAKDESFDGRLKERQNSREKEGCHTPLSNFSWFAAENSAG